MYEARPCRRRGGVFTPSDFLDVAGRAAVDQALSRLVKGGKLRRLARGLYDFPKLHPKLGPLSPAPDDVAQALARETGSQVQIVGARAANALGLSTQVPAKSSYLTDGPSAVACLPSGTSIVRHAPPKHPARSSSEVCLPGAPGAVGLAVRIEVQHDPGDLGPVGTSIHPAPAHARPAPRRAAVARTR